MNSSQRLNNRIFLLSNIDFFIKESVYHRTHSDEFEKYDRIILGNVNNSEIKKKLL